MKKVVCTVILFAAPLFGQTQPQPQQPDNVPGTGMASAMPSTFGNNDPVGQGMRDKIFLRKATAGGLAEVELGKLAAQKGGSDEVKSFGQKMVDDHTDLNNEMKPLADSAGVRVPTKLNKENQAEYDKLQGLSGDDFDKEYLAFMVKDHHEDLREFRMEEAATGDAALKSAVNKGRMVIRQHTIMVDRLARSKGVAVPERPAPVAPQPPAAK